MDAWDLSMYFFCFILEYSLCRYYMILLTEKLITLVLIALSLNSGSFCGEVGIVLLCKINMTLNTE